MRVMGKSFLKAWSRQSYRRVMNYSMSELDANDLGRSAIVFAPHQDDETLGCGGTIIKKKRAGADVSIAFMTDGSRSHSRFIAENELKSIRANEAIAAGRVLGVEENKILFLEFKDGELSKNQDAAVLKVAEILQRQQPDEIFIPYFKETPPDHFATNRIVVFALQTCRRKVIIYEYPIWFWQHWPWASAPISRRREMLTVLKNSVVSGLSLLRDFGCYVYIRDVLELKSAALNQYQSQMTRLIPDPCWATLGDVSNGEWLACFFQEYEIFWRYSFPGRC